MNPLDSPGEIRFDTFAEYLRAVDATLACPHRDLSIFDVDLRALDLGSKLRAAQLAQNMMQRHAYRMRIALHDTGHVERHCARVMALLTRFTHRFEIRRTPEDLRHLTECFVLADDSCGVVRFHCDYARGKLFAGLPDEAQIRRSRFEELWELSSPGVSPTILGL